MLMAKGEPLDMSVMLHRSPHIPVDSAQTAPVQDAAQCSGFTQVL